MTVLVYDFETYYGPKYSLTQLSYTDYVYDDRFKIHGLAWATKYEQGWVTGDDAIRAFFASRQETTWVAHNAPFDMTILHCYLRQPVPAYVRLLCTQALAALYRGFTADRLSLDALTGRKGYDLRLTYGKRDLDDATMGALQRYGVNDARITYDLLGELLGELRGLLPADTLDREIVMIDETLRLITRGLHIDQSQLKQAEAEEEAERLEVMDTTARDLGLSRKEVEKAIRSRERFAAILRRYGAEPPMKVSKTTGKQTFAFGKNDEGLQALSGHENVMVRQLVEIKMELSSTIQATRAARLRRLAFESDGLVPVHLTLAGAAQTLRWSGTGNKVNWQNLPRKGSLRRSIVGTDTEGLVISDYSAIEARVLAWVAGEQSLIERFAADEDVYVGMSENLWGARGKWGDAFKTRRQVGKVAILGSGYGAGFVTLALILLTGALGVTHIFDKAAARELGVDRDYVSDTIERVKQRGLSIEAALVPHYAACRRLIDVYRAAHPNIVAFWRKCSRLKSDGPLGDCFDKQWHGDDLHIVGLDGTRLIYHDLHERADENGDTRWVYTLRGVRKSTWGGKITENLVQWTARNLLAHSWREAKRQGLSVRLSVHDELVAYGSEAEKAAMHQAMSTVPQWFQGFPLQAETKIVQVYADK